MSGDVTVISTAATLCHGRFSTPQRKVWSRADSNGNTDIRIGQHYLSPRVTETDNHARFVPTMANKHNVKTRESIVWLVLKPTSIPKFNVEWVWLNRRQWPQMRLLSHL